MQIDLIHVLPAIAFFDRKKAYNTQTLQHITATGSPALIFIIEYIGMKLVTRLYV